MLKFKEDPEMAMNLTCEGYVRSRSVLLLFGNAIPTSLGIIVISLALWLGLSKAVNPVLLGA